MSVGSECLTHRVVFALQMHKFNARALSTFFIASL